MKKQTVKEILIDIQNSAKLSKPYLTVSELSIYTGFSESYIYKLCSNRQIPYYKSPTGKTTIFKRAEINSWLTQYKVEVINP
ncbi:MAG: helix-turn-helix domain-containing protein [Chitinophagaceae bacterium]|nr:helix-turn-helix domain-containing protein [Chitinophagaceae bacterium]MCB9056147.1 helix-turn-helix domain-containing protein [Chitinophagales bacterium]